MKKFLLLLTSGLLAASFAVPVWANPMADTKGMENMDKVVKMAQKSKLKGVHTMYGDVTNVDHAKGKLTLTNNEAEMVLHFPPDSIKDLKPGDTITILLGFETGTGIK